MQKQLSLLDPEKKTCFFKMGLRGHGYVRLKSVDGLEIICLMDNCVDLTSSIDREEVQSVRSWVPKRMGTEWFDKSFRLPIAEHGLSMLVKVFCDGEAHTVLFDTGVSQDGAVLNAKGMV